MFRKMLIRVLVGIVLVSVANAAGTVTISPSSGNYKVGDHETFVFDFVAPPDEELVTDPPTTYSGEVLNGEGINVGTISGGSKYVDFNGAGTYTVTVTASGNVYTYDDDGNITGTEPISSVGTATVDVADVVVTIDSISTYYLAKGKGGKATISFTIDAGDNYSPGTITLYANNYSWNITGITAPGQYTVDLVEGTDLPVTDNYSVSIVVDDAVSNEDSITVFSVKITASCPVATPNSVQFEGFKTDFGDPCSSTAQGKTLVIFFKDVMGTFTVNLNAEVSPTDLGFSEVFNGWEQTSVPQTGNFDTTVEYSVNLSGLTGGLHKITLAGNDTSIPDSGANVDLPLAGAEVKEQIRVDLASANTFGAKVIVNYPSVVSRELKAFDWFWYNGVGDYLGVPGNSQAPWCERYNGTDSANQNGVGTWFSAPIRVAKYSNFMVAYGMKKCGYYDWTISSVASLFGTSDDASATLSWNAGIQVANGGNYDQLMSPLAVQIYNVSDDRPKKLWPNNYNMVFGMSSPGFLSIQNP